MTTSSSTGTGSLIVKDMVVCKVLLKKVRGQLFLLTCLLACFASF